MALKKISKEEYNELCSVNKESKEYIVDYLIQRLENEKNGTNKGRASMVSEKQGKKILTLKYSNKTFDRFEYEGVKTINELVEAIKDGEYDTEINGWLKNDRKVLVNNLKVARANKKNKKK